MGNFDAKSIIHPAGKIFLDPVSDPGQTSIIDELVKRRIILKIDSCYFRINAFLSVSLS